MIRDRLAGSRSGIGGGIARAPAIWRRFGGALGRGRRVASVALLALAAEIGGEDVGAVGERGEAPIDVTAYCGDFAHALAERRAARTAPDSVRVEAEPRVLLWLSNLFQPPGSRFVAGHRCTFAIRSPDGAHRCVSVGLYLAQTRAFAEHTQWTSLQIVPLRLVRDSATGAIGHGVFKYLREDERG